MHRRELIIFGWASSNSRLNSTDKLGPVGRWVRHRLLTSILIGTPPLSAIQVISILHALSLLSQCTAGISMYSANCLRLVFDDNIIPLNVFVRSLFFDFLSIINYFSLTSFVSSERKSN